MFGRLFGRTRSLQQLNRGLSEAGLVAEGFDIGKVKTPLYFKAPGKAYVKLTKAVYDKLIDGGFKL